jgi:hypothetical protein
LKQQPQPVERPAKAVLLKAAVQFSWTGSPGRHRKTIRSKGAKALLEAEKSKVKAWTIFFRLTYTKHKRSARRKIVHYAKRRNCDRKSNPSRGEIRVMSSASSRIRNQIKSLGPGVVFATKQLLCLGTRAAVDHALCRLVGAGAIKRLAAGVFIAVATAAQDPGADEIARVKAAAFNRRIFAQKTVNIGSQTIRKYEIDGCRSSFKSVHGRLFFVPVTAKRLAESQNNGVLSRKDLLERWGNLEVLLSSIQLSITGADHRQKFSDCLNLLRQLPFKLPTREERGCELPISYGEPCKTSVVIPLKESPEQAHPQPP